MAHENLNQVRHIEGSSDRSFGLVFTGVFLLIAAWPLLQGESFRWWACGVAIVFALVALLKPVLLARLNRLWTKLGILLGKVVSPIALSILFYGVFTPIGIAIRLTKKDPFLQLKFNPDADTYWIQCEPLGPMNHQF